MTDSDAAQEARDAIPRLYRPSNGTEGEWFMSRWCNQCDAFDPTGDECCEILLHALAGIEIEQWRCDGPRGPRCTAFRENGEPGPLDPAAAIRPLI